MSKRTFWMVIGLLVGGLVLLPSLLVGLLALVNGLGTGNSRMVGTGAAFAGGAAVVGLLGWWLVRRQSPSGGGPDGD